MKVELEEIIDLCKYAIEDFEESIATETNDYQLRKYQNNIIGIAHIKQLLEARRHRKDKESVPAETQVSQPSELLPCPFCGSNPTIGSLGGDKQNWMIYCEGCKIPSAEMGVSGESLDDIKNNWNKRASQ